jgi:hypothetical protein
MKQITTYKKKGSDVGQSHPVIEPTKRYDENILTPVTLSGVLAPCNQGLVCERSSDYKLVSYSGHEYFLVADNEWRAVLSRYCWEEVKVIGLLNVAKMTLIPQKVYPKGPTGEKENVIDLAAWKSKEFIKKMARSVNDLVAIPSAVSAVI